MTINLPGYKILRTLGKGGMATVYLAEQEIFEREVALKVMSKSLAEDPSFGQRFMREAKIVSQLVHPNIVTVHDVGVHEGYYYLSMQVIDGLDLKQSRRSLSLRQKVTAIRDIAKALDYAGSKGYVHRDIKPENILFHTSDGRAVLTDFGIARAAESDLTMTQTGTAIGTPHYMSPEQAKGLAVDHRADLYSLGVVFYLLLANRLPFDAESAVAIGIKHITQAIPLLPAEYNQLQPLIDKLMAKKVEDRFQSAKELIDALDDLDLPVLEHAERMAADAIALRAEPGDPDAPTRLASAITIEDTIGDTITAPTIQREVGDLKSAAKRQRNTAASTTTEEDYEVVYEDDDDAHKGSWFPWVAGALVLCAVAGGVFYQQKPETASVWIDEGIAYIDQVAAAAEGLLFESDSEAPAVSRPEPVSSLPSGATDLPANSEPVAAPASADSAQQQETPAVVSGEQGDNASELDHAESPVEVSPAEAPEIVAAKQNLDTLKTHFQTEPAVLAQLVEAYGVLLVLQPENQLLQTEFETLQQQEADKIIALVAEDKLEAAQKGLDQYKAIFTDVSQQEILDIEASVERQININGLLAKADSYYQANALTRPAGENALDVYQQVIALDPQNSIAAARLDDVANKLIGYARKHVASEQWSQAATYVDKALAITPDSNSAAQLKKQIVEGRANTAKLEKALAEGKQALANGDYFSPANRNAYTFFQRALNVDANNATAKDGLAQAQKLFTLRVFDLVEAEQFDTARSLVDKAQQDSPGLAVLEQLALSVNERIAELEYAKTPRITRLVVSGQPVGGPPSEQANTIVADRSIHIAFQFENFQSDTAVIQAELTDGTETLQIAQVPVIVTGSEGLSEFSINRAVEGFPNGSYTVFMRLDGKVLSKTLFRVQN
ncbi:serine/threonine-protein kinase [Saccharophagus degradans]|uniref:non-specific serine/threonine protein kinase n=1 Tax=Saccharophagus degradans (strain 2-40 / ATCC 43961 / DSM 17024) TaxID=203122 RepID=Q21HY5_SACD2|nr:serine/threonine-protein kinase [Saccharophagus degradans]ABD81694.1 protein kinase [Saccharophagus degradans 2-40]